MLERGAQREKILELLEKEGGVACKAGVRPNKAQQPTGLAAVLHSLVACCQHPSGLGRGLRRAGS